MKKYTFLAEPKNKKDEDYKQKYVTLPGDSFDDILKPAFMEWAKENGITPRKYPKVRIIPGWI